jgi:hypothetical protein
VPDARLTAQLAGDLARILGGVDQLVHALSVGFGHALGHTEVVAESAELLLALVDRVVGIDRGERLVELDDDGVPAA